MFSTLANAWKIPELRKKLMFTLLMLLIYRICSVIPVPYIDAGQLATYFESTLSNTILGLYDAMSGSAFSQATVLALGIQPYINASIIIQLLTVAIPALERMAKEEGEAGKKKIERITRYTTIGLGLVLGFAYYTMMRNYESQGLTLITGEGFMPALVIIGMAAVVLFIIFINDAERRIPIQYAKRVVGRKIYGGQNTNLPIKVAMSGVMPVIFAQSICSIPATVCAFVPGWTDSAVYKYVLSPNSWAYFAFYVLMIFFFSWFYSTIQYDPTEISNNLKKNGGFIPGFRPGKPTADFIQKVINKIVIFGAVYLAIVAGLPIVAGNLMTAVQNLAIGGTSVIIVVGVALETVKALEAQMLMRHYKGFLD